MKQLLFSILIFISSLSWSQTIQDPDQFHGPRTKWSIYPEINGGASRHSIIPQLSDLSVADFMKYLETTGANSSTLNLENRRSTASSVYFDLFELTPSQINNAKYTPGQRNILLSNFLIDVQKAIDEGKINGNIRFHIHQRLYFQKSSTRESEFIEDFSNFINLCSARGVDHLVAGIRLGEHGTDGSKYLLQSTLRVAKTINEKTDGWLKKFGGLEMSGDGYGRDFSGINSWGTLSETFISEISKYTGYFAFCYKAFGVGGELKAVGFDNTKTADWETFLQSNMGFNDLISMIKAARKQYPYHANVIFIGDSGDALKLFDEPEYSVNTKMLSDAGDGFKGIIAVNGYRRYDKGTADDYLYFWDALDKILPVMKPLTIKRWEAWPYHDSKFNTSWKTVYAMAGIGGQIIPSGPVQYENGATPSFAIVPSPGFIVSEIRIDGNLVEIKDSVLLDPLIKNITVQVKFRPKQGKLFTKPVDSEIAGSWIKSDNSTVWHFTNKYCIYKSNSVSDKGSFYALYWYDFPDLVSQTDTLGNGEVILLNDDMVMKTWKLTFQDKEKSRLKVEYSDGTTGIFYRYNEDTPLRKTRSITSTAYISGEDLLFRGSFIPSEIVIYNLQGIKVLEKNEPSISINIGELQSGIYLVESNSNSGVNIQKIVIK